MGSPRSSLLLHPCFNPHPPLRADAMGLLRYSEEKQQVFQSSPALTGGCYVAMRPHMGAHLGVSILTRPYGRMLCSFAWGAAVVVAVSILTRPYGRMLWSCTSPAHATTPCFNPHPPLRADAMLSARITASDGSSFNPHPPLRADAMAMREAVAYGLEAFQSSPALTGGCYDVVGQNAVAPEGFQSSPALTGGCYV